MKNGPVTFPIFCCRISSMNRSLLSFQDICLIDRVFGGIDDKPISSYVTDYSMANTFKTVFSGTW